MRKHNEAGGRYALIETAGGVLSPTPSGIVQADLYRALRLPTILVGDSKLGGIGATLSAFESLHVRGYDVDAVVLFNAPLWENYEYLHSYFRRRHSITTYHVPLPPPRGDPAPKFESGMKSYYEVVSRDKSITRLVEDLNWKHFSRVSKLSALPSKAESIIWHPFRQHALPQNIIAIDSAHRDNFQAYNQDMDPTFVETVSQATASMTSSSRSSDGQMLTKLFDASASWWTQGLGHGNAQLALEAAHAAGRYGHVMFANAVHEPGLDLCYNLLETLENPRLARVFFTDNGSTGMEVAVKMALRASCSRYGWSKDDADHPVGVLGLKGSYHGDTIGVMNCSEPNTFNEKVDWYKPWGFWFDPPQVLMRNGKWEIDIPASMNENARSSTLASDSLGSIFDFESRSQDTELYKTYITRTLKSLTHDQQRRFGALIIEPILMGAGGMIFVDPLFQRTLITTVREDPSLINPCYTPSTASDQPFDPYDWTGVPLIADEVFTGLCRLGRPSSSSFLSKVTQSTSNSMKMSEDIAPDISVHAKLLTGGLLPLALTAASTSIFNTFLSPSKSDALLHGHSYTAHPVGCAVANSALKQMRRLYKDNLEWKQHRALWSPKSSPAATSSSEAARIDENTRSSISSDAVQPPELPSSPPSNANKDSISPHSEDDLFSFFSPTFLTTLSHHPLVSGCFALGTVMALTMKPSPDPPSPTSSSTSSQSDTASQPTTSSPPNTSSDPGAQQTKGYTSSSASGLQQKLLTTLQPGQSGIHARTLGDVLYIMTSLTTSPDTVRLLETKLLVALEAELNEREDRSREAEW